MANALLHSTSPYLLQHAQNPVDWVPWSEEVFEQAQREDRMVFLSIGYSTCHWCHVMEHESFEDPEAAALLNECFLCVKVDREERPDIDATYMAFLQATTGQGGWPMSIWLTPQGKPVVGGTYFPKQDRAGRSGLMTLCREIRRLWQEDRARLEQSADRILDHLRSSSAAASTGSTLPEDRVFGDFIDQAESLFDEALGGWGHAPKFPRVSVPRCLLQIAERLQPAEQASVRQMVEKTLHRMALGGIHDQLGGGFHRYSVDRYWHVPHYEKMLYDQAQLAVLYLEGWQLFRRAEFREVAEGIFRYVIDEMTDPSGAFHAAEDADSLATAESTHKEEGSYWTWTVAQLQEHLSPRELALFSLKYGVTQEGNARPESDPHGELNGRNTLFIAAEDASLAESFDLPLAELQQQLAAICQRLLIARSQRPLPGRDTKIITAWNGMMIHALAIGARILDRPDLLSAAHSALRFIQRELWDGTSLYRNYCGSRSTSKAFPADYAHLIAALIEVHGLDADPAWLQWAGQLQSTLDATFWDDAHGGYVIATSIGKEKLITLREDYDGAEPAPNHVAAENLLKLALLLENPAHQDRARALLQAGAPAVMRQPYATPCYLGVLDLLERGVIKIEVGENISPTLRDALHQTFLPCAIWLHQPASDQVIICISDRCLPPVRSIDEWQKVMDENRLDAAR
jgi:uncharacterized protein